MDSEDFLIWGIDMLITTHTIVGFTLGHLSESPYIAVPLAFGTHYLLDGIPHFEVSSFRRPGERSLKPKNKFELFFVLADILVALVFLGAMRSFWSLPALLGAFFGVLPDFLDNVFLWSEFLHRLPVFKQLYLFHKTFHWTARGKMMFWGVVSQVFLVSLCALVFWYCRV
ncbi:hypothetical protein J7L13_02375 [bacterium]|nr:hypothetical protein [bacterium]